MRKILFAMLFAGAASGCGQAGGAAFDKEFDINFRSSCVSSATRGGAPEAVVTQVCDCTLAGINAKFSTADKMTLSPEQAEPILDECMNKAVQR